jgi:hypothetical protein
MVCRRHAVDSGVFWVSEIAIWITLLVQSSCLITHEGLGWMQDGSELRISEASGMRDRIGDHT